MRHITIRRCPTCSAIGDLTDQLTAALRDAEDATITVEDGEKGEFAISADGRQVETKAGDRFRAVDELADELRGAYVGVV